MGDDLDVVDYHTVGRPFRVGMEMGKGGAAGRKVSTMVIIVVARASAFKPEHKKPIGEDGQRRWSWIHHVTAERKSCSSLSHVSIHSRDSLLPIREETDFDADVVFFFSC